MNYILNPDGTRNRDFRPAIQSNEWDARTTLYNPSGYQPLGFYERPQPETVTWMDVWRRSARRVPAAAYNAQGQEIYPVRINKCGEPVNTKYKFLYRQTRHQ